MTRLLLIAAAVLAAAMLLPLLPLFPPVRPQPATVPASVSPLASQTVTSLRSIARRRGIRTIAGVPVASCRRAALLAALA